MLSIIQITQWPGQPLEELVQESERKGFRFLRRLHDEWLSGANRFAEAGEALFGVIDKGTLVAVGGINRAGDGIGRLRRFYVRQDVRKRGIGRALAEHILRFASPHYSKIVLRTDTDAADEFYVALGFMRFQGYDFTHVIATAHHNQHANSSHSTSPAGG